MEQVPVPNPDQRLYVWRDENRAKETLAIFHLTFVLLGVSSMVTLCFLLFQYDYLVKNESDHIGALICLLGIIVQQIITPQPIRWCNPPKNRKWKDMSGADQYTMIYHTIRVCWYFYGIVMAIMGIVYLTKYDHYSWLWIFVLCAYVVDVAIGLTMAFVAGCLSDHAVYPVDYQPVLDIENPILQNPNLNKHSFYNTCVICLDNFKESDEVAELKCRHIFHPNCIVKWMEKSKNCPTCKMGIEN